MPRSSQSTATGNGRENTRTRSTASPRGTAASSRSASRRTRGTSAATRRWVRWRETVRRSLRCSSVGRKNNRSSSQASSSAPVRMDTASGCSPRRAGSTRTAAATSYRVTIRPFSRPPRLTSGVPVSRSRARAAWSLSVSAPITGGRSDPAYGHSIGRSSIGPWIGRGFERWVQAVGSRNWVAASSA
ncbi:hypothetical protein STANM309S_02658 [Streptomyces tanashiensis]